MSSCYSIGIRFCPTDEELITCYLKNKVKNQPMPPGWDRVMTVRNIYGGSETATPWILLRDDDPWQTTVVDPLGKVLNNQRVIYVFTKLSNVGKTGDKNKNRIAGCGHWHANTAKEPITKNSGMREVIGYKRTFTFQSKEETIGQWTMHEYELADASLVGQNSDNNYVLCRIKRDDSKSSKGGRLVSKKNDHGVEATTKSTKNKRKSDSEEGNQYCGYNKKLRSDSVQEVLDSANYTVVMHGEQTDDGLQCITNCGVDSGSLMEDQRQSMHGDDNHWPIILNEEAKDIGYVSSNADHLLIDDQPDVCFDMDELLLTLTEHNPLGDREQIDGFQQITSGKELGDSSAVDGAQMDHAFIQQNITSETDNGSMRRDQTQRMHIEDGTSVNVADQRPTTTDQEANIAGTDDQSADAALGVGDACYNFYPNLAVGDDIYMEHPDDDLANYWEQLYSNPSSFFDVDPSLHAVN